jgi:hypothetical protein
MPNKKSMLEREQYVAGGLGKFIPKNLGEKISEGIDYLKKHYDDVTTEPTPGQLKIEKATGGQRKFRGGERSGALKTAAGAAGVGTVALLIDDDDDVVVEEKPSKSSSKKKKEKKVSYSLLDLPEEGAATYETEDKVIYTNSAFKKAAQKAKGKTFKYEGTTYNTEAALDALERLKKAPGGMVPEEMSDEDSFRMMYNAYKQEMEAAESPEEQKRIQQNFQEQTQNVDQEVKMNVFKEEDRTMKAKGGSLLVPPEMGMESEMPVDTFTPEEQAMAGKSQVPDDQMEDDYMGFMLDKSLDETEQEYLMGALESDPRLSEIFDKVIMTASEFSGAGEVEGPGTGVSDSIPARLSDGEFVITEEATSEIGADNLQTMMDDAERKASGGKVGYAEGGLLSNPYGSLTTPQQNDEDPIEKLMLGANQMPSLMGGRR